MANDDIKQIVEGLKAVGIFIGILVFVLLCVVIYIWLDMRHYAKYGCYFFQKPSRVVNSYDFSQPPPATIEYPDERVVRHAFGPMAVTPAGPPSYAI